jgi:hypothetical protein
MARPKMRLGEFLVSRNLISKQDLNRALEYQKEGGGKLGQVLVALNLITEDKLLAALKYHLEIPILDLEEIIVDSEVLKRVPKKLAEKHTLLPVKITTSFGKRTLLVVMSNPMDIEAINEVEFAAGVFVQPVLAKERDLLRALNKYYGIDTGFTYSYLDTEDTSENEDDMTIITGGRQFTVYEERSQLDVPEEDTSDADSSAAPSHETPKPASDSRAGDSTKQTAFMPERRQPAASTGQTDDNGTAPSSSGGSREPGPDTISDLERHYASLPPASRVHLIKIIITQLVRQKRASLDDIEKWFQNLT